MKYDVVHDALVPPYNGFGIIRTMSIELSPPKKRVELRTVLNYKNSVNTVLRIRPLDIITGG